MNASTEPRFLRNAVDLVTGRDVPYGLMMYRDDWMSSEMKSRVFVPLIDAFRIHFALLCPSLALIPSVHRLLRTWKLMF